MIVAAAIIAGCAVNYFQRQAALEIVASAAQKLGYSLGSRSKTTRVISEVSGEGLPLSQAYANFTKALMADDWEGVKTWGRSDKIRQIESLGGRKYMPLLKVMQPAEITIKSAAISGNQGTLTLKAAILGRPATGTVNLALENGRWKVSEESWKL